MQADDIKLLTCKWWTVIAQFLKTSEQDVDKKERVCNTNKEYEKQKSNLRATSHVKFVPRLHEGFGVITKLMLSQKRCLLTRYEDFVKFC